MAALPSFSESGSPISRALLHGRLCFQTVNLLICPSVSLLHLTTAEMFARRMRDSLIMTTSGSSTYKRLTSVF